MMRRVCLFAAAALVTACQPGAHRRVIVSSAAPAPIGPYSQAIEAGGTLYLAGQIGLDPRTGKLVEGGVGPQTRQALENLIAVLRAASLGPEHVVQATVYLTDLSDFEAMNAVYAEHLGGSKPARATVGVQALPRGARVEIALVAVRTLE